MRILQAENVFQAGTVSSGAAATPTRSRSSGRPPRSTPDEPEFGIWQSWRVLVADDPRAQHAASALRDEGGARKNARCAQGYLFLGQMAKLTGDLALAEATCAAIAVAPEHVDLVRELRYSGK